MNKTKYYCQLTISGHRFNYYDIEDEIKELDKRLEDCLLGWSQDMLNKAVSTNIDWNWSKHYNL